MIATQLQQLWQELQGTPCRLIAVSKTKPAEMILEAYQAGQRLFGENKVQEMVAKHEQLPADIEWHLIGHLQSNKVKYIAPFVSMIHSVDSERLLAEIDRRAAQNGRAIDCLLQMHIAQEETKFGFSEQEAEALLESTAFAQLQHVRVVGLMGMATNTDDEQQVRREFRHLRALFEQYKQRFQGPNLDWKEVSMGMSGDYAIAVEEGSTLVRVGSAIFGDRQYGH